MNTFEGMSDVSKVEQNSNATMVVVEGEEMQSTAIDITGQIEGDLESVKSKLLKLSQESDSCWKESAGDSFRSGASDMIAKLDSVIAQLTDAAKLYQRMGSDAVDLANDNANKINASLN